MCVLAMPLPGVLLPLISADVAAIFVALWPCDAGVASCCCCSAAVVVCAVAVAALLLVIASIVAALSLDVRMLMKLCPFILLW